MSRFLLTYAKGFDLPNIGPEHNTIKALFDQKKLEAEVEFAPYSDRNEISRLLLKHQNTLEFFSYSGHVNGEYLVAEAEELIHINGIAGLLKNCPKIKLVLLNGCGTKQHVHVLKTIGIAVIIYTNTKVKDVLAKKFAEIFFTSLLEDKPLGLAFENAKSVVHMPEDGQQINFQVRRGLELDDMEEDEWGIYLQSEEYAQCTLNNWIVQRESLFNHSEHSHKYKMFFLGDKSIKESIYLKIKHLNYNDHKDKRDIEMFWQGIWDIHENLNDLEVAKEIAIADAVFLCVNGEFFIEEIWSKAPQIIETIKQYQKPVFYLHAIFDEDQKLQILEPIKTSNCVELLKKYPLPNLIQSLNDPAYQAMIKDCIKFEIIDGVRQFRQGIISDEAYQSEFMEFDLTRPFNAFKKVIIQKKYVHLFCIEGARNSGQDFLLNRLRQSQGLSPHMEKLKIDFFSQEIFDDLGKLWDVLIRELEIEDYWSAEDPAKTIVFQLLNKPTLLVFDNVFTADMTSQQIQQQIALINQFWQEFCKKLPPESRLKEDRKIFIFIINRCYDELKQFKLDGAPLHSSAIATVLPAIEPIEPAYIQDWYYSKNHKLNSPEFKLLDSNYQDIASDGHLENVLTTLGDKLNFRELYTQLSKW